MNETTRTFPEDTLGTRWVTWSSHPASRTAYQEVEEGEIRRSCTCGRQDETSPALHSGTCPVWQRHHNL